MTDTARTVPGTGWATPSLSVFQLGKGKTLAIPMNTHTSSRMKLVQILQFHHDVQDGIIILRGGEEATQYDSDTDLLFR